MSRAKVALARHCSYSRCSFDSRDYGFIKQSTMATLREHQLQSLECLYEVDSPMMPYDRNCQKETGLANQALRNG